jgi:choloylglycine hydrolase
MKLSFKSSSILLSLLLCANTAMPCTTFVLKGKGRVYFGKNLDWFWEDGLVLINPKDVQKTAFLMTEHSPVKWTSRFGSVTFNQFGRELPFGGMNEAGLVVENMQLGETGYAAADSRPAINLLQWIQYHLDNCRTVAEVIATDQKLRVESPPASMGSLALVHYLVCDADGDCAALELLDGKLAVHRGATLPCPALANSTYEASAAHLRTHPQPAQPPARARDQSSLSRFAQAAARASAFKAHRPEEDLDYAFDTLGQVCQGDFTVWRIVYDVSARKIHYCTRRNDRKRSVDLKSLDFSGARAVQFVDIQAKSAAAQGLPFEDLTEARHRKYLESFYSQESLKEKLGDLRPLAEGLLLTLRGYVCSSQSQGQ